MTQLKDAIYKINREKLDNFDRHYVTYSDKLSTACRQLAFSEGAVFWIFKESDYLSVWIAFGLIALVLFFCVDIFQYYFGMIDYEKLANNARTEMKRQEDEDDHKEIKLNDCDPNKRLEQCFKWKIVFIGISSVLLMIVFLKKYLIC